MLHTDPLYERGALGRLKRASSPSDRSREARLLLRVRLYERADGVSPALGVDSCRADLARGLWTFDAATADVFVGFLNREGRR